MSDLKVTLIQTSLIWEDHQANIDHFDSLIRPISNSDLIILPETFSTGFSMQPKGISVKAGKNIILDWMRQIASDKQSAICGSFIVEENNCYYNRFHCVKPDGSHQYYDKRHLFRMAGEDKTFTQGNTTITINIKGWRVRPFICYDLRFPVWSRSVNDCDMMLYVANWPAARSNAWKLLLQARAIENQVYVVGVNRIGEDAKAIRYVGNSRIIDPKGAIITDLGDKDTVESHILNKADLEVFREKFPVHLDADTFTV